MRFVSHLDMTRFMTRMIRRTDIPVWYTEGFHPHLYLTFALPLSLGFESTYEVMDLRVTDDDYDMQQIQPKLNAVFPPYVQVFAVAEPVMKTGKIAYADFSIVFEDGGALTEPLKQFLSSPQILCQKMTKKGIPKEIDLVPKIFSYDISSSEKGTLLTLTLPAGGQDNVNPTLLLDVFFQEQKKPFYAVTRTAIYDDQHQLFR